jgi:hypothetical protein
MMSNAPASKHEKKAAAECVLDIQTHIKEPPQPLTFSSCLAIFIVSFLYLLFYFSITSSIERKVVPTLSSSGPSLYGWLCCIILLLKKV